MSLCLKVGSSLQKCSPKDKTSTSTMFGFTTPFQVSKHFRFFFDQTIRPRIVVEKKPFKNPMESPPKERYAKSQTEKNMGEFVYPGLR